MLKESIPIYIMGKEYQISAEATILNAFEQAGYKIIRGCGCRSGFCGACATFYRFKDDHRLRFDLACQKVVEPNMYLAQLPFFLSNKRLYDMDALQTTAEQVVELYPEVKDCIGCKSCVKVCPQGLKPLNYVALAKEGKFKDAAEKSFDCIMCGLCASRCPRGLEQYNIGILARRLYGRYLTIKDQNLDKRILETQEGRYDEELRKLKYMPKEELQQLYIERDITN
ncbi:4Fe-4S dicluster domain-containing protein [Selenihalanaerobacter shriftii]|uniref:2Fe-2S iron-sulfur cluster binding domain-containing protein n=1 Tax=Selenihalanaerobacter shriftii TaxID=142842 RepID=A0A1T4JJE9_9FIRM|nr:4Fe-4S dicluster domain-containing protein [Selenihalanaerobacter shriftii]SJZ30305.1 2Fe-2S iron-sulfur cluster binding domain-containing protein [Selenihalanaerobacter shriftii]